ncbi:MAG: gluconokinase [Pyrinomonadaceae bacterium]|nr:gluconokinase [Pyrinomonadaceae bacterium]MCX7640193.1 gluconokinase [Pyrinomonadaceae bacterium]MDW8303219.1 gluconokinase [Acidobacteriota bacterium]
MSYVLAIDIGTSGIRAAVFDQKARLISESFTVKKLKFKSLPSGECSLNPSEILSKTEEIIDETLAKANEYEISAVGVSCFWHSLLGIGQNGKPTTDLILWNDTRSQNRVETLKRNFNESKIHNLTGARFHCSFWPAKLLWLREEQTQVFNKTAKWLSLPDLLMKTFCGEIATSISMASGTGIFDIRSIEWAKELLEFLELSEDKLPEIAGQESGFYLRKNYTSRWRNLEKAKWITAIGDGVANNLGLNCTDESKAVLMIGSSGALRVLFTGEPPQETPKGLWCYRLDEKRIAVGGALSDGGLLQNWIKENLRVQKMDFLKPDSHKLVFLPFLAGERSTGYSFSSGTIFGLRTTSTASDILQASLEAVAYRFAAIFDQIQQLFNIQQIIANGKVLWESKIWTQIISDVLGANIRLSYQKEASLRGAATFALENLGYSASSEKPRAKLITFNPENHEIYKLSRKRHERLYEILTEFDKLI